MSTFVSQTQCSKFVKMGMILLWMLFPFFVYGQMLDPVSFTVKSDTLKSGQLHDLEILAHIDDNWHLYSIHNSPADGPIPTRFSSAVQEIVIAGDVQESEAEIEYDPNFGKELGWHSRQAKFTIPVLFDPSLGKTGEREIGIWVSYQTCDDMSCLPPKTRNIQGVVYVEDADFQQTAENFTGADRGFGTGAVHAQAANTSEEESQIQSTYMFLLSLIAGLLVGIIIAFYRKKSKQSGT